MKKSYNIEVDCANCANLMEEAAKNYDVVIEVWYPHIFITRLWKSIFHIVLILIYGSIVAISLNVIYLKEK